MRTLGIDIGSRTVKVALVEDGRLLTSRVADNSHDPVGTCRALLEGLAFDRLCATGYGRHLFREHWEGSTVTEIRAVAHGARALHPRCRAVLDIGGQDTKVIALDAAGALRKFEMNDRCAAGTGRFLEVMAAALGLAISDLVALADGAPAAEKVNAMCTVFAESEVISLVARGTPRDRLALGLHEAVARRAVAMLRRVELADDLVFCGGGARNTCLRRLVSEGIGRAVHVTDAPQIVAAYGAALLASG